MFLARLSIAWRLRAAFAVVVAALVVTPFVPVGVPVFVAAAVGIVFGLVDRKAPSP